ncbi:MAG: DUF1350 family protein [Cyanobacteria bacterium J06641_5]
MDWQEIASCWTFGPRSQKTKAIIHFLGGAFVGTAPQLSYRWLLEQLGRAGYLVIATPYLNDFEHGKIARDTLNRFENCLTRLNLGLNLPIYGLGHSMGCKIHLLVGSLYGCDRAGNILLAYNNDPARSAVPLVDRLNDSTPFTVEFVPSPTKTLTLIAENYPVRRNLVIRFRRDSIDCSEELMPVLETRCGSNLVSRCWLPGDHLTPTAQALQWQSGTDFSPLDAAVQWARQEFLRDIKRLRDEILRWLDPTATQ